MVCYHANGDANKAEILQLCSKMGTRAAIWRRLCPDEVASQFDEVPRTTLYILHQTGPTGFVLKEDGIRRKIKVS